jgi:hypothetical protein
LAVVLATKSACFSQKVVSASKAVFCTVSAKFNPCAFTSHSSQVGCVGHTGIFTFTSHRSSWPVVMSSRAEYSRYVAYPKSFRVPTKVQGNHPPRGSSSEATPAHQRSRIRRETSRISDKCQNQMETRAQDKFSRL